ncbi:7087_t:CDS:10 [Dentiscutata erythropus]|uniref:7087_t:CDS:1 n=1 Tax=Dentiscutata erythropus TaxID=1348616 RepID=A0A9N9NFF6_9GLOM|nr:7087_t:CDS:10 [Dentiscutata erythropus]
MCLTPTYISISGKVKIITKILPKSLIGQIFNLAVPALVLICQLFTRIAIAKDEIDDWDEEIEITEVPIEPVSEPSKEEIPAPKPLNVKVYPKLVLSDFYREMVMIAMIVVYLIVYFIGKRANEAIAVKWMEKHIVLLRENFSLVGNDKGGVLIQDGPAEYLFYLSGRRNCQYIHGKITLKPRHDMLQTITNFITSQFSSKTVTDTVTYNVTMNDGAYDDFVFGITKKDRASDLRQSRYDLKTFTKQTNNNLLPSAVNVHSESVDITEAILSVNRVIELLNASSQYLTYIIISDQTRVRPEKIIENKQKLLTVMHELPNDASKFSDIMIIAELTRQKLIKNREEADKVIQKNLAAERQEEIQQKKADKKRAEAERVAKLSPEEQRKYEEKERKRELKKKQKKLVKKV